MRNYTVITPLRNGGKKPVAPGKTVKLDADEGDDLVASGALALAADDDKEDDDEVRDGPVKLDGLTKVQLVDQAKAEGLEVDATLTNAKIVEAIEIHRAKPAD